MVKGLYTSAVGMVMQTRRMDVVADNIANAQTAGFKRNRTAVRSFSEELANRLYDPADGKFANTRMGSMSLGVFVDDIYTDFSGGSLRQTNSPLDLAINGGGFFCVSPANQAGGGEEYYTRDGSFTLGADGTLMTKDGASVLGTNGVITIPAGSVEISDNGDILSDGEYIDTLKLTDFADTHELRKQANNLYSATERAAQTDFVGNVESGFLENSNVSAVREMVDMISISRAYETNQRMITVHDQIMARAVSDIGRKV